MGFCCSWMFYHTSLESSCQAGSFDVSQSKILSQGKKLTIRSQILIGFDQNLAKMDRKQLGRSAWCLRYGFQGC